MPIKILFCGLDFAASSKALSMSLPNEDVQSCHAGEAHKLGLDADVLVPLMHRLEPELIGSTRAGLIHQFGVGLEGVDVGLATSRGIPVCNVPADVSGNAESTAEHAVFLMLGISRRIHQCFSAFHRKEWGGPMGETLYGATALIVGLGRVGKAVARRLACLGMQVNAIRRSPADDPEIDALTNRLGKPSDLYEMAADADYVIATMVLNNETRGLFDRKLFERMKPTAFVINVARGPVVNEADLSQALNSGRIAGAGLDVFAKEPADSTNPLIGMENVFATPHIGGVTRRNVESMARVVAENIVRIKEGKKPLHCVNQAELYGGS